MSTPKYSDDDLRRVAGIMDEMFDDQLTPVLEAVTDIQVKLQKLDKIEGDVEELKSDIKVVKTVVTDTNRDLMNLNQRVDKLASTVYGHA